MKKKLRIFFKTLAVTYLCLLVFVGSGYAYLNSQRQEVAQNKVESVPYTYIPDNAGILFEISDSKILINLDFYDSTVTVIFADDEKIINREIYGYIVDYTIKGNSELIGGLVDRVSGIDIEKNGEILSVTGAQIEEMITTSVDNDELRREIISKILEKISKNGFSKEDFLYIIENSKTDLTVPDCYFWQEYIEDICKTVRYVN